MLTHLNRNTSLAAWKTSKSDSHSANSRTIASHTRNVQVILTPSQTCRCVRFRALQSSSRCVINHLGASRSKTESDDAHLLLPSESHVTSLPYDFDTNRQQLTRSQSQLVLATTSSQLVHGVTSQEPYAVNMVQLSKTISDVTVGGRK